jgi:hypothetical protein
VLEEEAQPGCGSEGPTGAETSAQPGCGLGEPGNPVGMRPGRGALLWPGSGRHPVAHPGPRKGEPAREDLAAQAGLMADDRPSRDWREAGPACAWPGWDSLGQPTLPSCRPKVALC